DRWAPRTDRVTRLDGADLVVGGTSCIRLVPPYNRHEYRDTILPKPACSVRPALATASLGRRALGAGDAIDAVGAGIRCQEWIRAGRNRFHVYRSPAREPADGKRGEAFRGRDAYRRSRSRRYG